MFVPPSAIMLLSAFVGNGAQIICTTMVAVVFACIGFLSPPNRGALTSAVLVSGCIIYNACECDFTSCLCVFVSVGDLSNPRIRCWLLFSSCVQV